MIGLWYLLPFIYEALTAHELLPEVHLVDASHTDAAGLGSLQHDYGVTLLGPVAQDPSWQAKAREGFDKASFIVNWEAHTVTCPADKQNYSWRPHEDRNKLSLSSSPVLRPLESPRCKDGWGIRD